MRVPLILLSVTGLVSASPGALPACGGNVCYPILTGAIKDIAKDFCSFYLKYPRSTTTTIKSTVTSTSPCTLVPVTSSVTATATATTTTTTTTTETQPGPVVTETMTATVTAGMKKRAPVPVWSPPKGSGPDYKPPLLGPFAPSIVSAGCSCVVTPTTTTFTATSTGTTTVPNTCTKSTITTTVGTTTSTITVTATTTATTILPPTTVTSTVTTTVAPPAPTCQYPRDDQREVRGTEKPNAPGGYSFATNIADAQACFNYVKNLMMPWSNQNAGLMSYAFMSYANPGGPDGPGDCNGYKSRSCENLQPDPNGNLFGGDISLGY